MVGAHDAAGALPRTAVEQPRCAVPAYIEERPDAAVRTAHRHQRFIQEVQRVIVPGVRDVAQMADDLPRRRKDAFFLGFQEIGVTVYPAREAETVEARRARSGLVGSRRAVCIHDLTTSYSSLIER